MTTPPCSSSPPWRMDRHTMALLAQAFDIMRILIDTLLQAQAGAMQRVKQDIMWIIIGKRTMCLLIAKLHMHIVFDTLPPLRQGAHTKVTRHMNNLQGMGKIFINMFHLHRQGDYLIVPRRMNHL